MVTIFDLVAAYVILSVFLVMVLVCDWIISTVLTEWD
jgi:hypothetical protein